MVAARDADRKCNRSGALDCVTAALQDLARDTNAPPDEVFEGAFSWLELTSAKGWVNYVLSELQEIMERNWSREEKFRQMLARASAHRPSGAQK